MTESVLLDNPWITRRKLDVHEYHRMGEAGIFGEKERVELIEGELIEMSAIGSFHSGTINRLTRLLVTTVGARAVVAVQNPVRLDDFSEPEPDFALLRPRDDDYTMAIPTVPDVLLLVEVADSSLRYDRAVKLPLYGRHGIAEVWIVDLERLQVEVCRGPTAKGYSSVARLGAGSSVEPLLLPGVVLRVDTFLR
jgi:Uma2 family endonuclease